MMELFKEEPFQIESQSLLITLQSNDAVQPTGGAVSKPD